MPIARILLWLVSVSALVWCALSFHHPLPGALELGLAFVGLFLYATLGVLWPHCGMYGDALWRGKAGSRQVALTFDDGPHPITTRAVLEILRAHDVRATFFLLGHMVARSPGLAAELTAAGHEVGVHGWEHRYLPPRGPKPGH